MSRTSARATESQLSAVRARFLLETFGHPTPALTQLLTLVNSSKGLKDSTVDPLHEGHAGARAHESTPRVQRPAPTPPLRNPQYTDGLVQLVVDYANGLTQMEIAKKHGIHVQTVRKRLRDAGVNTRSRVRLLRSEQLDAARSAIADGASLRATAQSLGVSHTTLQRNLKQKQG